MTRRILVLHGSPQTNPLLAGGEQVEFVYVDSLPRALELLRREHFAGVLADIRDLSLLQQAGTVLQADRILELLEDGVALVDQDWHIVWANPKFRSWCNGQVEEAQFYDALGSPEILGPEYSPFHTAAQQGPVMTCLRTRQGRFLELTITPVRSGENELTHYIALARDITRERQRQQKLDAIHRAGRELAALDPQQLARMTPEDRIELLKHNILAYTHDLLHYDVIEVRLLDPATGKLELLVAEGITPEAAERQLYARPQGNGITGFVATSGKSYLCPDTTHDPLYLEGARGARSSLTVPLIFQERVIGTFNVESPKPNAFTEEDQQFLEIFCREIAHAIYTLELLAAEKRETVSRSLELVRREMALPLDEILITTATLQERYIGHDDEIVQMLRQIQANARAIKQCIERVGETMTPQKLELAEREQTRLRGLRVLVVDSDERVRRSAHGLLERFGCIVETARGGKEAVCMARLNPYDAIVADIHLPDGDCYDICQQLRQVQPSSKIILMSGFGYDAKHTIIRARQDGLIFGTLFKPFRVEQLLSLLESLPRNAAGIAEPLASGATD